MRTLPRSSEATAIGHQPRSAARTAVACGSRGCGSCVSQYKAHDDILQGTTNLLVKMKTNAARVLDNLNIKYSLREYEVDPDDLSAGTVAEKIGFPLEQVFKTLVARGDKNGVCLAVIPGDKQLDLKALAKLSGNRSVDTVALKEVQPLTGYIRGGVTALACKKDYPVFADENMYLFEEISVSAGARGTQIIIGPEDYIKATNATVGSISRAMD